MNHMTKVQLLICTTLLSPTCYGSASLAKKSLTLRISPHFYQSALRVRLHPNFENISTYIIKEDGYLTDKVRWLENDHEVILGNSIFLREDRLNRLKKFIITASRKVPLPLLAATIIGGKMGLDDVFGGPHSGASAALELMLVQSGVQLGVLSATLFGAIGFSPQSTTFVAGMKQRVLLKNGNDYYYGYPKISEALRAQGAYSIVDVTDSETQQSIPTEKIS